MAIYNGSIKVLPCNEINIPQPGTLVRLTSDAPAILLGGMTFVRDLLGTDDRLEINTDSQDLYELFINQKISGSDVLYINQTAGPDNGKSYILEITGVNYEFHAGTEDIKNIILFFRRTLCSPPSVLEWLPAKGIGNAFDIEIYRGNYSTTTGLGSPAATVDLGGYSGAGNSDGYALSIQEAGLLSPAVEVLTVNNDKVPLVLSTTPQELKVVKVFCPNNSCSDYEEGGGIDSNIYAFSFEF